MTICRFVQNDPAGCEELDRDSSQILLCYLERFLMHHLAANRMLQGDRKSRRDISVVRRRLVVIIPYNAPIAAWQSTSSVIVVCVMALAVTIVDPDQGIDLSRLENARGTHLFA